MNAQEEILYHQNGLYVLEMCVCVCVCVYVMYLCRDRVPVYDNEHPFTTYYVNNSKPCWCSNCSELAISC